MDISEKILERLDALEAKTLLAAKNVLTFSDVMLLTGYGKDYLRLLMHRKEIPYYKPNGRNAYFDRKEIEDWLRRNRVTPVYESDGEAAINAYLNS